jgi:hypothetical protein
MMVESSTNGENMGRPSILVKPIRKQVTLDEITLLRLKTIHPSVSEAIRILASKAVPDNAPTDGGRWQPPTAA